MTTAEAFLFAAGAILLGHYFGAACLPRVHDRMERKAGDRARHLREDLLFLSPGRIVGIQLAFGLTAAVAVLSVTGNIAAGVAAACVPTWLTGVAVRRFRKRRRNRIAAQLPSLLDLLAGALKAGHSFPEGLCGCVPLLPRGLQEEAEWLVRLLRLGTPLSEALRQWEARIPCEEIALTVRPLRVALATGGNLVDLLERSRDILRARARTREKLSAMTAQGRLQATVLTLLSPCFLIAMSWILPGFLSRCLGSLPGRALLAASILLQILGWICIRRILTVKP